MRKTLSSILLLAEERWKGYEQRKKLEENSILKNLEFRNVNCPTTMKW